VDNFLGYNAEWSPGGFKHDRGTEDHRFWVGDLMLECRARLADAAAAVTLELSKGANRYQAEFSGGTVTLTRTGPGGGKLGTWPTPVAGGRTYDLRFANIDCRLRVWVDGAPVPLGPEADYPPSAPETFDPADAKKEGWTTANDVAAPASVGAAGGVEVSHLKLWRDTYYTNSSYAMTSDATATVYTYFVQPGHYLCLGDNSAQSSDGRTWGTVPERLMLGRAVFVFAPFLDANYLLKPRLDRVGFIK
jgi:signal peptidase I